jgi:hypothetical protein
VRACFEIAGLWLLFLAFTGCGEEQGEDTTPPEVQSTQPADGETGVAPDVKIRITFDEAIDRNTLDNNLFHLEGLWGSVSYDLVTHQATLSLMAPLDRGATYQAVLEPGVRDLSENRNRMNEAYRWSFTVAE